MTRESCRDTTLILSIDPGTIHSLTRVWANHLWRSERWKQEAESCSCAPGIHAEARWPRWTRHLKGDQIDVRSAGITAKRLDPARGSGDGGGRRRHLRAHQQECRQKCWVSRSTTSSQCVIMPKAVRSSQVVASCSTRVSTIHPSWQPQQLLKSRHSLTYRRVRDEIRAYVEALPGALRSAESRDASPGGS